MLLRKPFYFLRHGQTDWNKEGRYQGQRDIPLNEEGQRQAEIAGEFLKNVPLKSIITSSLVRATRTAEVINKHHSVPLIRSDELRECHYGSLEGQLKDDPLTDQRWKSGITPQGAESYDSFSQRIIKATNLALKNEGPLLIVAHRAVFWPLSESFGLQSNSDLENARPVLITPPTNDQQNWSIEYLS